MMEETRRGFIAGEFIGVQKISLQQTFRQSLPETTQQVLIGLVYA